MRHYIVFDSAPLSPVHTSNNVEATFDFVERTKFQRKTRSTLLPFLATKSNVASTLLPKTATLSKQQTTLYGFDIVASVDRALEICVQSDRPPFQIAKFRQISAHSASTVIASENNSIITYRKSTTRFPTSHRWTVYVTPKSPKGWHKNAISLFVPINSTSLEKNLLQKFFVWKLPAAKL